MVKTIKQKTKVVIVEKHICDFCNNEYSTKNSATLCETRHKCQHLKTEYILEQLEDTFIVHICLTCQDEIDVKRITNHNKILLKKIYDFMSGQEKGGSDNG